MRTEEIDQGAHGQESIHSGNNVGMLINIRFFIK